MKLTQRLTRISDLFDRWRTLGTHKLPNGIELLGRISPDNDHEWMHVLFPPLHATEVRTIEDCLGAPLPPGLRALYRGMGGLTAFGGLIEVSGYRKQFILNEPNGHEPSDILRLNRIVNAIGWLPEGAIAFATNGADSSVYVTGMPNAGRTVQRCALRDGRKLARHEDIFEFLEQRLYAYQECELQAESSRQDEIHTPAGFTSQA